MVFMGQAEPAKINLNDVEERLARPELCRGGPIAPRNRYVHAHRSIRHLRRTEIRSGFWVQGSQLNRDRDLRLQYLAGVTQGLWLWDHP